MRVYPWVLPSGGAIQETYREGSQFGTPLFDSIRTKKKEVRVGACQQDINLVRFSGLVKDFQIGQGSD